MLVDGKRIVRVFTNRTRATPNDEYAFVGPPPIIMPECDEIHISCVFTWDKGYAIELYDIYTAMYKNVTVKLGGPAFASPADEFIPGLYVKPGYIITSRGCPKNCWYCYVPKREGKIKELAIHKGWNILDNNILACSGKHIDEVFRMLSKQKNRAEFTGGLDATLLTQDLANDLKHKAKSGRMFFAYDKPSGEEPLRKAGEMLEKAGISKHQLYCYVLIGYPKDTMELAEQRLRTTYKFGFIPFAMLYRDDVGNTERDWRIFQRLWIRPAIIRKICENDEPAVYNYKKSRAAIKDENQTKMF